MEKENVHEHHRQRVREEFLKSGFNEKTPKHKVLEMILFYCVPRVDTNVLAHLMLDKYKTLTGVFTAPASELMKFKGITENGVMLLRLFLPVANICADEGKRNIHNFKNLEAAGDYTSDRFAGITDEKIAIMLLDRVGRKLDFRFIANGDIASVGISVRQIVQICLETNAAAVILAHNHPSGVALPSEADISNTQMLAKTLKSVGINLLDHIIIAAGDYVSMAQSARYREIFITNTF